MSETALTAIQLPTFGQLGGLDPTELTTPCPKPIVITPPLASFVVMKCVQPPDEARITGQLVTILCISDVMKRGIRIRTILYRSVKLMSWLNLVRFDAVFHSLERGIWLSSGTCISYSARERWELSTLHLPSPVSFHFPAM